jgi:F0F1-type ATP synthase membrane subunit b/b'
MAVSSAPKRDAESPSTLTQLVEAEQRWRHELDECDRECASLLRAARERIEHENRELDAELSSLADAKRRELSSDIEQRIARERAEVESRVAKLSAIDSGALEPFVERVLARVFWAEGAP